MKTMILTMAIAFLLSACEHLDIKGYSNDAEYKMAVHKKAIESAEENVKEARIKKSVDSLIAIATKYKPVTEQMEIERRLRDSLIKRGFIKDTVNLKDTVVVEDKSLGIDK